MKAHRYFGPFLFLASEMLFTVSFALAKYIAPTIDFGHLLWLRFVPALVLIPFFWSRKIVFRVGSPKLMLFRSLLGVASIGCFMYSLKWGELGRVCIINASGTLWAFFWSMFVLKERPHIFSGLAIVLTLLGLFLIFQPSLSSLSFADLVALLGSFLVAMVYVSLKKLRETHNAEAIVFCFFMTGLLISTVYCVLYQHAISWHILALGLITGVAGFFAQILMTVGYRYCPVSVSSFIKLSSSVVMVAIGMLLFGDPFNLLTSVGMAMVIGSIYVITVFQ